jgi:hypothetical protein
MRDFALTMSIALPCHGFNLSWADHGLRIRLNRIEGAGKSGDEQLVLQAGDVGTL